MTPPFHLPVDDALREAVRDDATTAPAAGLINLIMVEVAVEIDASPSRPALPPAPEVAHDYDHLFQKETRREPAS